MFAQAIPLPGAPKMSWETTATYGTKGRLLVKGDITLHKEQKSAGQHDKDHTSNFTQVRAAASLKPYSCFGGLM